MNLPKLTPYQWDLLERVAWTMTQAALGVLAVAVADLPPAYAPVVAAALAAAKGWVARKLGDPDSAATLSYAQQDRPDPGAVQLGADAWP